MFLNRLRLTPGTKYYYIFGCTVGSGGFSGEQVFTSPPVPGPNVTTKILAYGGKETSLIDDD